MQRIVAGLTLFLAPVIGMILWITVSASISQKAIGLGYLRSFATAFFLAGTLFLVAGFALLRLPR